MSNYCTMEESEDLQILKEIAFSFGRTIREITRRIDEFKGIRERAKEKTQQRLQAKREEVANYQERLKQYNEQFSFQVMEDLLQGKEVNQVVSRILQDKIRKDLEDSLNVLLAQPEWTTEQDVESILQGYQQKGYIDFEDGEVNVTSRGARILAKAALKKILENLAKKGMGLHPVDNTGYGSELSVSSRRYEPGDEYELVDIEKTLLHALERSCDSSTIFLKPEDFEVYETIHQTQLCAGLIIDESGSMKCEDKIRAAIETSLALSELIRQEPQDSLRVFIFSEQVREILPWKIANVTFTGGTTDIRSALTTFRKAVTLEKGDKQVYLITDSEPNTENGVYLGFERAMEGVLKEALRYRQEGITLNIIMLDENSVLKAFASKMARLNLGRVFFTSPSHLGEVLVEDYLRSR